MFSLVRRSILRSFQTRNLFELVSPTKLEEVVKKSRFVAYASNANNIEDVRAFINSVKDSKASHNCWAFVSATDEACSDDREVSNTAGPPILNAIKAEDLTDCVVVVTRYFGGIKLGTGGLVRAYGGAARSVLRAAPKEQHIPSDVVSISGHVSDYDVINRLCVRSATGNSASRNKPTFDIAFAEDGLSFHCKCRVPADGFESLRRKVIEVCNHQVEFSKGNY